MKMNGWRSAVAIFCCAALSGCTTSRWVTDSRQEVIPDASVIQARPVLDVAQHSQERPELLVRLSKERTGPIELQEVKHEEVHKVWGISPWKIIGGWLELGLSPVLLVGETLNGTPGRGIGTIISGAMAAVGFNPPRGMGWDLNERDVTGENKTEVTRLPYGTQTVPWPSGPVEVKIDDLAPINLQANQSGYVEINFKRLPVQLTNRSKDLTLSLSAQVGDVTAVEHVTVSASTIVAWERKETEQAKLESEKKAQQERELVAKRGREAQVAREAAAKREYERQHPEIVAARKAKEAAEKREQERQEAEDEAERKAESDANMALMMQGVGMLGQIMASQQERNFPASRPPVAMPRSLAAQQAMSQAIQQAADGGSPSESRAAGGQTSQPRCEHKEGRVGFIAKCNCEGGVFRETHDPTMKDRMGRDVTGAWHWNCNKGGQGILHCVAIKEPGRERCLFN
ncbi:MAG: hypothetical protein ABL983_04280 [Nitrospira sp.]